MLQRLLRPRQADDAEDAAGGEAVANLERRRVRRRIDDNHAHVADVGADREAEEQDLHDGHEDQDEERPPVAENVVRLLSEEPEERLHVAEPFEAASSGRTRRTNSSSIDATPASCLSVAGDPSASIRPETMIEIRSQYSASSM